MRGAAFCSSQLLALALFILPNLAQAFEAKVVGVHDGDTITVLDADKVQHKIRMGSIDAPELGQPYGQNARQAMAALVFGKTIEVEPTDTDRYGRTVAVVLVDGENVNREMVREGAAWAYRQYLDDPTLVNLEAEAKAHQRGLWALQADQIMPPWEWRRGSKTQSPTKKASRTNDRSQAALAPARPSSTGSFTCSGKRVCREMSSCAEAQFYLSQCGLSRLDGDGDGVPCEKIC